MNNCCIDIEEKIKIPQNFKKSFIIDKSRNWKYAIRIKIDLNDDIDFINLFLILKSYALNQDLPAYAFAVCFEDETKTIVAEKQGISFLKKISYENFTEWLSFRLKNDSKYDNKDNFYCLLILYNKNLIFLKNKDLSYDSLQHLRPEYPWSDEWLSYFSKSLDTIEILQKKVKRLEYILSEKKNPVI